MRTTRLVMTSPFRGRRRSRDRRSRRWPGRPTVVRPRGDEAGDREGHRQAVVVEAVDVRPGERSAAADPEVVAVDLDDRAQRARVRSRCPRSGPTPCGGARRRHGSWSFRSPRRRRGRERGSRRSPPRRPRARGRSRGASDERTRRSASGSPTPSSASRSRAVALGRASPRCPRPSPAAGRSRRAGSGSTPTPQERQIRIGVDRARRPARTPPPRRRRDTLVDRPHRSPSLHRDRHSLPPRPSRRSRQPLRPNVDPSRAKHPLGVVARRDRLRAPSSSHRPGARQAGSPT